MVLEQGDEIILSEMEHHSNIIPWQEIARRTGAVIKVCPVSDKGEIEIETFKSTLSDKTKIVSITSCSNVLGTNTDMKLICSESKKLGAYVLVDAAQSVSHSPTDVQDLDCDFLVFSGHKLFGPYGIGVLYGKEDLLNKMPPYQTGGSMISEVSFEKATYLDSPQRFEAGTPNVAGAIGLAEAIRFVVGLGFENIKAHDQALLKACNESLSAIDNFIIYGDPKSKSCIIPFNFEGIHSSDIGSIIDNEGVAIRTGHHCCQPLMKKFGVSGTGRASFSIYNTLEDVEVLVTALKKAKEFF